MGGCSTLVSWPTTAELCATLVLVWVHSVVTVSCGCRYWISRYLHIYISRCISTWQSSMVVMSTTVLHTVLATLRGVDTGTCTAAGDMKYW